MNIQNYLNDRVENQVSYYSSKSALNKHYYLLFKVSQLIAAALLPFLSVFISDFSWAKYLVAFLGTLVTILEGVLAVGKYHEKWITYRSTAEALRQEKFLFLMQAGSYTSEDANLQFVNRIELILGKENLGWQQMIVKEKENDAKGKVNPDDAADTGNDTANAGSDNKPASENEDLEESTIIDPVTGVSSDAEEIHDTTEDVTSGDIEEKLVSTPATDKPSPKSL